MFEEGVDILFKAFAGEPLAHRGNFWTIPPEVPYRGYTLKEITLVPAPEGLPVECWQPIQSSSERAFDFMARYGIGGGSAEVVPSSGTCSASRRLTRDGASSSNWASGWRSATSSTSRRPASRRSARLHGTTKRA